MEVTKIKSRARRTDLNQTLSTPTPTKNPTGRIHKKPEVHFQLPWCIQAFKFRTNLLGTDTWKLIWLISVPLHSIASMKAEKYEMQTQDRGTVNSMTQRGTFCLKNTLKNTLLFQ